MTERRKWTIGEIKQLKKLFPRTETEEIAEILGRSPISVRSKASSLGLKKDSDYLRRQRVRRKTYALYKGDDLIAVGTLEEIAEHQDSKISTIKYMSFPSYHKRAEKYGWKRKAVFEVEDE